MRPSKGKTCGAQTCKFGLRKKAYKLKLDILGLKKEEQIEIPRNIFLEIRKLTYKFRACYLKQKLQLQPAKFFMLATTECLPTPVLAFEFNVYHKKILH